MEDGCLELTSCCAVNVWGTQSGVALQLLCPRSVPTRNSLLVLQHILPSAHSAEPRAAPVPSRPPPTIPGGCSALCMTQQGEEQPGGWGDHFGHLCPAWGAAAFPGAHHSPIPPLPFPGATRGAVNVPIQPSHAPCALSSSSSTPQQPPASPLSQLCPRTPTEGLGVDSPLIYHLSGGGLKKSINKTT